MFWENTFTDKFATNRIQFISFFGLCKQWLTVAHLWQKFIAVKTISNLKFFKSHVIQSGPYSFYIPNNKFKIQSLDI